MESIVFLGSGTSEGIPLPTCLVKRPDNCRACPDAYTPLDGRRSRNLRRPPCILVRRLGDDGEVKNILIDCGKHFWPCAIEWFPKLGVSELHAILLSHDHTDAAYGMDDLRCFTRAAPIAVYARARDLETLRAAFRFLFPGSRVGPGGGVPQLEFKTYDPGSAFEPVKGIEVTPLPVEHGLRGACGFRIADVCVITDAVAIPDETIGLMGGCHTVVIDALRLAPKHGSHFTVGQALAAVRRVRPVPRKCWLIGMNHEVEHHSANEIVRREANAELPLDVELAYDGLQIDFDGNYVYDVSETITHPGHSP